MSMSRTFAARVGLLALLALGTGAPVATAQTTLRWTFKEGETLRYEFRQKNAIKGKLNGQDVSNTSELTVSMTWKVRKVAPDKTAEITLIVDRAQVAIASGKENVRYDSKDAKPNEGPVAQMLHAVYGPAIGQDYTLKIDARGEILDAKVPVKVTEALASSPFRAMADSGGFLSEKGVKNMFAQVIPAFPEKPVAKGDTWKGSLDLPQQLLVLSLAYHNTLDAVEPGSVRVKSTIDTTIRPGPDAPLTVEVKKQSGTGTFTYDPKAGRLSASEIKQAIELVITIMTREVEQSIEIDEQLKLVP